MGQRPLARCDSQTPVKGVALDPQTRCVHYHSVRDIIAIKMRCCGTYYACRECHDALADHPVALWPKAEWDVAAILCGACGVELSIGAYLAGDNHCPSCAAPFNPGCKTHHHLYFEPVLLGCEDVTPVGGDQRMTGDEGDFLG